MPVKVRCTGCDTTLNAPDKARGKSIACPKCGTKLKVPAEEAAAPAAKAKPKKKEDSEDFLNVLDKIDAADSEHEICPYCAAALDEDDPVCPKCGMNVETGKMDAKMARKKAIRGPDPSRFYKAAWRDSWEFFLENRGLWFKTSLFWLMLWMAIDVSWLIGKNVNDLPIKIFWYGINFLCRCAMWGWYASLATMFVRGVLTKDEVRTDRIQMDFFQSAYLGAGAIVWPWVVFLPVLMLVGLLGVASALEMFDPDQFVMLLLGTLAATYPLAYVSYPIALAHQSSKYSYKGWIAWELLLLFFKNAIPTLYTLIVALVITAIPLAGSVALFFLSPDWTVLGREAPVGQYMFRLIDWLVAMAGNPETLEFYIKWPIYVFAWMFFGAAFRVLFAFIAGFACLFMVKVLSLFSYFNQTRLGLVPTMAINEPATFWVRFLAFWGDLCLVPLTNFLVSRVKMAAILGHCLMAGSIALTYYQGKEFVATYYAPLWMLYNFWMYFAVQESSAQRTTVVKEAFGLIVSTEKDKQLSIQQATKRFFGTLASALSLGVGFLLCALRPDKKALQDLMSKTRVTWRGDK